MQINSYAIKVIAAFLLMGTVTTAQATSGLPIAVAGTPCVALTTGTAPNQTASEGLSITVGYSLLSCQSGVWTALGSTSASVPQTVAGQAQ